MTTTFCISGAVILKAGAGGAALTDAQYTTLINEAECAINVATRKNWIDAFASLNADVKLILEEAASNLAAMYAISYCMSGYSSRAEAETMLDVLYNGFTRDIELLKDMKQQDFMTGA